MCHAVYHAKCIDFAARNLREDKSLRWWCTKCLVFDIEFYSFLKNAHLQFIDLTNNLNNISGIFNQFQDLNGKYSFSQKRKKFLWRPTTIFESVNALVLQ